MSYPSEQIQLEYAPESSFAETSTTFATYRPPLVKPIDPGNLRWDKEASNLTKQYMHGDAPYVLMGQSGSFDTLFDLRGHGATMVGSPTIDPMETLLSYVFGKVSASLPASTTLTGGTATAPTTTASGTFPAGGLCSIGAIGDGAGNAQVYAISTHSTTTLNLLTGLTTAPTNGDVLRPCTNIHFHETAFGGGLTSTVPGLRFRFMTPGLQYACHGCVPTSLSLTGITPGGRPQIKITWEVSRWAAVTSGTWPSSVTSDTNLPAATAGGSLFVADVGTATRTTRTVRDLSIDITLGMQMMPSYGNVGAYQKWGGCTRLPSTIKWSWTEDADSAATATPVLQGYGTGTTSKHILLTLNTIDSKQVSFYSPNVRVSAVPTMTSFNNIASMKFEGMAHTGSTTTNDLTASAFRMGFS